MTKSKDPIIIFLAWIAIAADLVTLVQFIQSKNIVNFWTFQWFISICSIFLLIAIGLLLLNLAKAYNQAESIISFFGGIYFLSSIAIYGTWGFDQVCENNTFSEYMGFVTLYSITLAIGIYSFHSRNISFLIPSYGFAFMNIAYILLLVYKYVFYPAKFNSFDYQAKFNSMNFGGEIIIMILGATVFISLYQESSDKTSKYKEKNHNNSRKTDSLNIPIKIPNM